MINIHVLHHQSKLHLRLITVDLGIHSGPGLFSDPSNANVHIMGISQAEFGPRGIKNEWVLFDETIIWKQILLKTG